MVSILAKRGLGSTGLTPLGPARATTAELLTDAAVNVSNGNLILAAEDARLSGRGGDLLVQRTYNALDDNDFTWRWTGEAKLQFLGPGTPAAPAPGARILRTGDDGEQTEHAWNEHREAFVGGANEGADDWLRFDENSGT